MAYSSSTRFVPAGSVPSAATAPGSGLVAPAGQSRVIRAAANPCWARGRPRRRLVEARPRRQRRERRCARHRGGRLPNGRGLLPSSAAVSATRTIGSACTEASLPAQSVAWIVTGKMPAPRRERPGHRVPAARDREPACLAERRRRARDEGFETQKETAPGADPASLNAGGRDSNVANSVAAVAKRGSLGEALEELDTYSW